MFSLETTFHGSHQLEGLEENPLLLEALDSESWRVAQGKRQPVVYEIDKR